jgi:hypothetical protein
MHVQTWLRLPAATSGWQMRRTDPMGNAPEDVPEEVIAQAKAAFGRRGRGEIATLTWDSLVDEDAVASDHRLRFAHPELQIELRLLTADKSSDLAGRVIPHAQHHVELQGEDGDVLRTTETVDGVFAFDRVPSGMVRLCVRGPSTPGIHTDWFRL